MKYQFSFFFLILSISCDVYASPASVADGGTGISSVTNTYAVLAGGTDTTTPMQIIPPGISGQVLSSNDGGSLPVWAKINGLILLRSVAISGTVSSVVFNQTDFSPNFSVFMLVLEGLIPTSTAPFYAQWSTDNGSTYLSSGYSSGITVFPYNGASSIHYTRILNLILGPTTSGRNSGVYFLFGMNGSFPSGTGPVLIGLNFAGFNSASAAMAISTISGTPNVNAMKIYYDVQNISQGNLYLYGLVT